MSYNFRLILLFFVLPFCTRAQQCSCEQKFEFVKQQMEHNYAGFRDKVTDKNRLAYTTFTNEYQARIKKAGKPAYCFELISEWLQYFKEGHIQLYAPASDTDSVALADRINKTEIITLSPQKLEQLKNAPGIEGIYTHNDGSYIIAIVKNKTAYRDYAGVIVSSATDLWKPGQVKLEIKEKKGSEYPVLLYLRDHNYRMQRWSFDGAGLNNGEWIKTVTKKVVQKPQKEYDFNEIYAKIVDDKTLYIQIGSFSETNAKAIDSVFKENEGLLQSMPNLILDLRGNGGGADFSFTPILPYVYTNPVIGAGVDVLATPDNAKGWATMLNNPNMPEGTKEYVRELLDSMQNHPGEFISSADDDTLIMDSTTAYPQKIAILIDGACASTTEQFLLIASESKKVTLMGQHTFGALDYSNMRPAVSPCKDLDLSYATTKSRRIAKGQGIDNIGIKPKVLLSKDKDWIEEARKYLEK